MTPVLATTLNYAVNTFYILVAIIVAAIALAFIIVAGYLFCVIILLDELGILRFGD